MRDVAEVSGLSLQTVSRVANGEPNVNDATRERVLDAMRELGYRPNLAARAMRRGSFKTIGIVYQGLHAVGTRRTVESVSEHAAHAGYATTLMPIDAATRFSASGAFTRLEEMAVDVMVMIVTSESELDSRLQVPKGVPVIVLGPQLSPEVSAITADIAGGESEALRYVLGMGHETVHHITGHVDSFFSRRREEVWREVLEAEGRRVPPAVEGDWTARSGYLAMRRLLDVPVSERPTAVFCANDQSALGAYRAIREAGLRVPEDISVIGFDDIEEAADFSPPLTTIAQDWDLLGREMMRVAQETIAGAEPQELLLPTRLVVRDSVAPPRG